MFWQIIILFTLICVCCTLYWKTKEHFWFIPQSMYLGNNDGTGKSCANLSRYDCKRRAECGYCKLPNGASQCIAGDWTGSLDGTDCEQYEYGTDYANISMIDPPQPYYVEPNRYWNFEKPIYLHHDHPEPISEGAKYFHHRKNT